MYNKLENFSVPYNEDMKRREKSVEEIAKFILDHLTTSSDFLPFLCGQELSSPERGERWQERLGELLIKAQKRAGYRIDSQSLILEARQLILQRQASGELPESAAYLNFCNLSDEDLHLSV